LILNMYMKIISVCLESGKVIHSFNKHFLCAYYVQVTMLDIKMWHSLWNKYRWGSKLYIDGNIIRCPTAISGSTGHSRSLKWSGSRQMADIDYLNLPFSDFHTSISTANNTVLPFHLLGWLPYFALGQLDHTCMDI
jgi:hypothetical protein